jgi:hypothetical protein
MKLDASRQVLADRPDLRLVERAEREGAPEMVFTYRVDRDGDLLAYRAADGQQRRGAMAENWLATAFDDDLSLEKAGEAPGP